nr:PREDICTED: uncharacterized protein LOC108194514 [Daucus carota subsp. sativus]
MYVTRSLSHYRNNPESLSLPPEGPNLGYLVIRDEEPTTYSCFGLCKRGYPVTLPFSQNKNLTTMFISGGEYSQIYYNDVSFIPVLNQSLSSNRYYVIERDGKDKGMAYACSTEEDKVTCCFCRHVQDVKPRPFDPHDTFQHFEIANFISGSNFVAKSVVPNAFPPHFLRRKGWNVHIKTPKNYVLGKWYSPFMFIKDGTSTSRDQMENSMFYEMTLEQRWDQIFERDNIDDGKVAMVDAVVQTEIVLVGGREAVWNKMNVVDNTVRFKSFRSQGEKEVSVGLSLEIVERMKWEEERVGWVGGDEGKVRVNRVEEFGGGAEGWKKFGCYVLVESFVLKRMDGSLVMTCDFKHCHQIKCLWY